MKWDWLRGGMWANSPRQQDEDWRSAAWFVASLGVSYLVFGGERKIERFVGVDFWWVIHSLTAILSVWCLAAVLLRAGTERITLNGWRRLWIVLSIIWAVPAGLVTVAAAAPSSALALTDINAFNDARRDFWRTFMLAAVAPPAILYLLGLSIAWIRRGFRGA